MDRTGTKLTIAVDFDGTIVEHRFPDIGEIIPGAFEVLRELQEKGHRLILWTVRDGIDLKSAVDFCLDQGVIFYAVNESYPNEEFNKYISRKVDADMFIDDRNIGGFLGWAKIRQILLPESISALKSEKETTKENKKGFWSKVLGG